MSFLRKLIETLRSFGWGKVSSILGAVAAAVSILAYIGQATPQKQLASRGFQWTVESFTSAADSGDLEALRLFLKGGMAADTKSSDDFFVISHAAQNKVKNLNDIIDLFLSFGCDLNEEYPIPRPSKFQNRSGKQISADLAYIALVNGRDDVVRHVIEKGGDLL